MVAWLPPYLNSCHWQAARAYLGIEVNDALEMAEQTEV
jgi:hypothetical protein